MTILLVEDENRLAAALLELFHAEKYLADHADNGEDGLYAALWRMHRQAMQPEPDARSA